MVASNKIKIACANCGHVHEISKLRKVKTRTCELCERKFKVSPGGKTESIPFVKIQACFVATAAYGTPFAQEIDVLRDYRDDVLSENSPGRAFVRFYYKVSPPIANVIGRHESLRKIVRKMLNVVVLLLK